ncbi:hypothetical protein [Adhaeribacter aquaticus]|uniref:hypothetical protein n=1 Tax=Adhaeribacter aquaticus TaxID=299567 RepID=UPI00041581D0|nr:hypothetical protein [Adhaeribacter aquaticus]
MTLPEVDITQENDCLLITYKPALSLLHLYWKQRRSPEEFKQGLEIALNMVMLYNPLCWLNDITQVGYGKAADANWIINYFLANLVQNGIRKFIGVVPNDNASKLLSYNMVHLLKNKFPKMSDLEMVVFVDAGEAMHWVEEVQVKL